VSSARPEGSLFKAWSKWITPAQFSFCSITFFSLDTNILPDFVYTGNLSDTIAIFLIFGYVPFLSLDPNTIPNHFKTSGLFLTITAVFILVYAFFAVVDSSHAAIAGFITGFIASLHHIITGPAAANATTVVNNFSQLPSVTSINRAIRARHMQCYN